MRAVGIWLGICALMVFIMMQVGAVTRLTESGLSMAEWRPLIGWLPPITQAEWERVFALYRQTSQYQLMNEGMALSEFKTIFFWEYFHRLWGRLIGLVYALPFFFFLLRGWIPQEHKKHLWILLVLGGLQGVIGWWMVKSGFVDRVEVSQYRLAVHLGMAVFILGYLFWMAFAFLFPVEEGRKPVARSFRRVGALAHAVIFFTVVSGAFVAGLNAGLVYNEWPLMGGGLVPEDYWSESPLWLNLFENVSAVQFNHRIMAYITTATVAGLWIWSRSQDLAPRARLSVNCLSAMVAIQVALGIATLLHFVPIPLAVAHQAGAGLTFILSLWVLKELRGDAKSRQKADQTPSLEKSTAG
ncbi:COX15/CtaA family protein [Aestuariispira insulae]|uniref:Heme A synthase n=1 Tax=Aestuariispira insulae TaxID=1461337 RepID=A0A3D9HJK8_9PROT|nr:COX15/CtaA family protein [Aestuariispira insulae]RED49643.1 cytochrome c oxidase assembly protein subunit 15 [Aestuariispira insulae]